MHAGRCPSALTWGTCLQVGVSPICRWVPHVLGHPGPFHPGLGSWRPRRGKGLAQQYFSLDSIFRRQWSRPAGLQPTTVQLIRPQRGFLFLAWVANQVALVTSLVRHYVLVWFLSFKNYMKYWKELKGNPTNIFWGHNKINLRWGFANLCLSKRRLKFPLRSDWQGAWN